MFLSQAMRACRLVPSVLMQRLVSLSVPLHRLLSLNSCLARLEMGYKSLHFRQTEGLGPLLIQRMLFRCQLRGSFMQNLRDVESHAKVFLNSLSFYIICVHACPRVCMNVDMFNFHGVWWRPEDNLQVSILSFHHVHSGAQSQVIRLHSKYPF